MKRYLIFVFSALFGIAQIAQAAKPDDAKKGKQKAPQAVRHAQQHVGQPRAAFRAPSNVQRQMVRTPAYNPGNTKFHTEQRTWSGPNNGNVHFQKKVNNYNAAQRVTRNQNNRVIAARNAQRWTNQNNNAVIATRNGQRWTNHNVNRGNWSGLSFSDAYRRRDRGRHHRDWWRSHYGTNFSLFGGGYYYWNDGYWYPAYGYDPAYSTYEYDGPIYGYNNLAPGDVVTNVQSALQQQGYYDGEIDGSIGPMTRAALRRYQRDNGLEITAAIDQPTLSSLGLT